MIGSIDSLAAGYLPLSRSQDIDEPSRPYLRDTSQYILMGPSQARPSTARTNFIDKYLMPPIIGAAIGALVGALAVFGSHNHGIGKPPPVGMPFEAANPWKYILAMAVVGAIIGLLWAIGRKPEFSSRDLG